MIPPAPIFFHPISSLEPIIAAAGRVEFVELSGFSLDEVGLDTWKKLSIRGGFPKAFLPESEEDSVAWREGFIRTFLERDIPQLGITIPAAAMRRFWSMLAHYHGQTWNASELFRSMGLSDKTVCATLNYFEKGLVPIVISRNLGVRIVIC